MYRYCHFTIIINRRFRHHCLTSPLQSYRFSLQQQIDDEEQGDDGDDDDGDDGDGNDTIIMSMMPF